MFDQCFCTLCRCECVCMNTFIRRFTPYHVPSHHSCSGSNVAVSFHVKILFLFQASKVLLYCQMGLFLWSCHLAAQIVSHRVCLLPSKACVQPDVSVTYFIIGSNQHQIPGRRGCCRWLLFALLPCLSERLCQALVN